MVRESDKKRNSQNVNVVFHCKRKNYTKHEKAIQGMVVGSPPPFIYTRGKKINVAKIRERSFYSFILLIFHGNEKNQPSRENQNVEMTESTLIIIHLLYSFFLLTSYAH